MARLLALVVLVVAVTGCTTTTTTPPPVTPSSIDVTVFLADPITEADMAEVQREIKTFRLDTGPRLETREEAYENFKKLFSHDPELVNTVRPESLPQSFRLTLADRADLPAFKERMAALPAVEEVVERDLLAALLRAGRTSSELTPSDRTP